MNLADVLMELQRRQRRQSLLDGLHPGQRRIVDAMKLSRYIAVRSPRRWGKTEGALRIGLDIADKMNARCVYLAQYRTNAKSIAWPIATLLNEQTLNWTPNLVELALRGPGARELIIMGADRPDLARLLRGWKNCIVIIDESQDWTMDLRILINSILRHTLTDLRGFLLVLGTPGWAEDGFYWSATTGQEPEWIPIVGGMLENPHTAIQQQEEMAKALEANANADKTSWWRREYCGEWVADDRQLIYPFTENNIIKDWNNKNKKRIMGIDWGSINNSAFIIGEFDTKIDNHLTFIDAMQEKDVSLDRYVQIISDFKQRWAPIMIVADPGGTNKALTTEISTRCRISIQNAEKTDKEAAIAAMVRDLSLNIINVASPQAEPLLTCWRQLQWSKKQDGTREEKGENHLADCALYVRRACWNYLYKPPPPELTEAQRFEKEERDKYNKMMAAIKKRGY